MDARRIRWLAGRLASMGPQEIFHRCVEQVRRRRFRSDRSGWQRFDIGDGSLPRLPGLAKTGSRASRDMAEAKRAADSALQGTFRLLGQDWPSPDKDEPRPIAPDLFLLDPVSGSMWPGAEAYCFNVPYRHERQRGDVKYVWELNRLQFLQPVAATAVSGDGRRDWVAATIQAWMDANPPFRGINWASGLELALRSLSVIFAVSWLQDDWQPPERERLRSFFAAHAFWLDRFPSRHSSANNHAIGEAAGLFAIAVLMPDLPKAPEYEAKARKTLEKEARLQIHPDGVGAEQSPTYAAFTLELLAVSALIARQAGRPFSDGFHDRLALAAEHFQWLLDEAGNAPLIGDNDEGRVVCTGQEPEELYVASVCNALAGLLGKPELAPPCAPPHLRNLIFDGGARGRKGPSGTRTFPEGGYTIVREAMAGRQAVLCFDHGPLGYLSIAAHGHADALALWLHLDGEPVIVDAGTYLYHSGGAWRDYFRSTPAHNTLSISGESSSRITGPFNWGHRALAQLVKCEAAPQWRLIACHDGYRKSHGLVHERTVAAARDGFTITDRLLGAASNVHAATHLLFHPSLALKPEPDGILISRGKKKLLRLRHDGGEVGYQIIKGQESPPAGWYAPRFGTRMQAPLLTSRGDYGKGVTLSVEVI